MKKFLLYLFSLLVIIIVILFMFINRKLFSNVPEGKKPTLFEITTNNKESFNEDDNLPIYYELDDRYIYIDFKIDKIEFTYNNRKMELKNWFEEDPNFLALFIKRMEQVSDKVITNSSDGGSKIYNDGNIGVIICDTINNDKNIYIGQDYNYLSARCGYNKKTSAYEKKTNDKVVNIFDKLLFIKPYTEVGCATDDRKYFYEDETYGYSFRCDTSYYVLYESGYEENAFDAFVKENIDFNDLDKYKVRYEQIKKAKISTWKKE